MGTLDDAIREHLDLKRRHGATEDEVKQKEDEAFGRGLPEPEPVMEVIETEEVIEPEPFQGVVPGEEPFAELDDEPQSEPVPEVVPEPLPEPAPEPLPEPVAEVEYAEQVEEVVVEEPLPPEPRLPDLEPLPEPDFELPAPNEPRNEPLPEPDFELRVSGEPEEAVAGPSDELLDERPDFIEDDAQDDLWFDQKPPKDFNFD